MAATRGEGGGGGGQAKRRGLGTVPDRTKGKTRGGMKPSGSFSPAPHRGPGLAGAAKFAGEVSSNFSKGVGVVAKDVGSFKGPTLSDLKFPGFPDLKPNLAPPPSWINPTGGKKNKWP